MPHLSSDGSHWRPCSCLIPSTSILFHNTYSVILPVKMTRPRKRLSTKKLLQLGLHTPPFIGSNFASSKRTVHDLGAGCACRVAPRPRSHSHLRFVHSASLPQLGHNISPRASCLTPRKTDCLTWLISLQILRRGQRRSGVGLLQLRQFPDRVSVLRALSGGRPHMDAVLPFQLGGIILMGFETRPARRRR